MHSRLSLEQFCKFKQSNHSLKDGNIGEYLKKLAATACERALHKTILLQFSMLRSVDDIKAYIEDNLDRVRNEFKNELNVLVEKFLLGQLTHLTTELTQRAKKSTSVAGIVSAFLQHIQNADRYRKSQPLQRELARHIRNARRSGDQMHSMWLGLDKINDPDKLGLMAARHFDSQRELPKDVLFTYELGKVDSHMPTIILLPRDVSVLKCWSLAEHLFKRGEMEHVTRYMNGRLHEYQLEVCKMGVVGAAGASDLFSAVALVAFSKDKLLELNYTPEKQLSRGKRLALALPRAAFQLRGVAYALLCNLLRKADNVRLLEGLIDESKDTYLQRVRTSHRGDMYCLSALADHLNICFHIWCLDADSVVVGPRQQKTSVISAFHLVLCADAPDCPKAENYLPCWYPVKPTFVSLSNAPKKVPDARDLLKTTDAESTEEEKDATGSGAPPAKRPRV